MNNYLLRCKELLFNQTSGTEPLLFVMGNESCDLDSAVSSLCLAYFYEQHPINPSMKNVVPVLNISRANLPLKTEVVFYMKQLSILPDDLICSDEVNFSVFKNFKLILVDCHMSKLEDHVISIIDHRPIDKNFKQTEECKVVIEEVGSCATLVFREIMKEESPPENLESSLKLLYGAIILDTVNFSKEADKARALDKEVVESIENLLAIKNVQENREALFKSLVNARSDVSCLDSLQILSKDLKILQSRQDNKIIAIPGFPILVREFIKMERAEENLVKFQNNNKCNVIILMGMKITHGTVERDIGIVSMSDSAYVVKVSQILEKAEDPDLKLQLYEDINTMNGKFYQQQNVKVSRKQIIPLLVENL